LLTDGINNAGTHTPAEAAERAKRLGIPVYTLGFGEKSGIDERTLMQIAATTGGAYYYAPSPDDLRSLYANLSQLVSGHVVSQTLMGVIKAGESRSFQVNVEPGLPYFLVRVSYSGSKLAIVATRPDGVNLTGVESNVVLAEGPGYIHLAVYRPASGTWTLRVVGVETPAQGTQYTAVVALPPLSTYPHELVFEGRPGESQVQKVRLTVQRPLPSLEVKASPTVENVVSVSPSTLSGLREGQVVELEVRVRIPSKPSGTVTGNIELRTAGSVIFLPVRVAARGTLRYAFSLNSSVLYEGEAARLIVTVLNDTGSYVSNARVAASVGGKNVLARELATGQYELVLSGLKPSDYVVQVSIEKSGYPSANFSVGLTVTPIGDVNADGVVDYRDVALIVGSYGLSTLKARPRTDLNHDDIVDYRDLAIVVANYGRSK